MVGGEELNESPKKQRTNKTPKLLPGRQTKVAAEWEKEFRIEFTAFFSCICGFEVLRPPVKDGRLATRNAEQYPDG